MCTAHLFYLSAPRNFSAQSNKRFKTLNTEYFQKLLSCIVASAAICEDDPETALEESTFNHGIRQVAVSINHKKMEDDDNHHISKLKVNYMVCESSNHHKKQLVITFRETEAMKDFLLNLELDQQIEGCDGYCHSSVFFQSAQVPLDYFINKIESEDYEIVFTGHSLGASIASLVAVRLLMDKRLKKQKNVLFIGFGSPPFVDEDFKKSLEPFKHQFHFYLNVNDSIVNYLHSMMNVIYTNRRPEFQLVHFMKPVLDLNNLQIKQFNKFKEVILLASAKVEKENYFLFGTLFKSNDLFQELVYTKGHLKNLINNFKRLKLTELKNHGIDNYLSDIEKHYLNNRNGFYQQKSTKLESFTDLSLPHITQNEGADSFSVKQVVNEFNTDIFINIRCKNNEFINGAVLKGVGRDIELSKISFQNSTKTVTLVFTCPNKLLFKQDEQSTKFRRYTKHKLINGFSNKRRNIEQLPLDKLYTCSMYYYKTLKNSENGLFSRNCEKLKKILKQIDTIWKLKNKTHKCNNKKNKHKLQKPFLEYFEGVTESISDVLDGSFDFNEHFVSLEECANAGGLNQIIKDVPTFFELLHLQSSGSLVSSFWEFFPYTVQKSLFELTSVMPMIGSYMATLDSYIQSISSAKTEQYPIDYDGCFETVISDAVNEGRLKNDKNDKILQTILLNRQIRDILIEYFVFGVMGSFNCGKSKFVQIITGIDMETSANITKTKVATSKLTDSVMFFDYPNFNMSNNASHKIQFLFTRYLFDHIFIVYNASIGMTSNEEAIKTFKLVNGTVGENFTILLNRADLLNDSQMKNIEGTLKNLKREVCEIAGSQYDQQVFITCLKTFNDLNEMENFNWTSILNPKKLKKVVLEILLDKMPDTPEFASQKADIYNILNYDIMAEKLHKEVQIENARKNMKFNCIITLDKDNCKPKNGYDIIDSFEDLVESFQYDTVTRKMRNPVFKRESPKQHIIKKLEDFFVIDDHIFTVTYYD